jgi:hypothetical protein
MTSLGFLLAAPMLTRDFSRVLPIPLERLAGLVHWIGLALFFLSMWFMFSSMANYYRKYRHVLFDVPAA